jgi:hypothetical protein
VVLKSILDQMAAAAASFSVQYRSEEAYDDDENP